MSGGRGIALVRPDLTGHESGIAIRGSHPAEFDELRGIAIANRAVVPERQFRIALQCLHVGGALLQRLFFELRVLAQRRR